MLFDLVLGNAAFVLGALLSIFSARLATLMREGDDGWRERGWTQAYEPNVGFLESEHGRWWVFRGWLLLSATGFFAVGAGLVLRSVL